MIRIEQLTIKNFRGIRDLDLSLCGESFVIYGPNGSGKSAVVDAIEFALVGRISRLSGPGTGGLTVPRYGPHVDFRDKARESSVSLTVQFAGSGEMATITRSPDAPEKPTVSPDTPPVHAQFERAARFPEIVLSRREIIKYIIVEAARRAEQVQALLRLTRVNEVRAALRTATNSLKRKAQAASQTAAANREALKRTLTIEDLGSEPLFARINALRQEVGASPLEQLREEVAIDDGVSEATDEPGGGEPSKFSVLADLKALRALSKSDDGVVDGENIDVIEAALSQLQEDPELRDALDARQLLTIGLDRIRDGQCPLCGADWNEDELRTFIRGRLESAKRAEAIQKRLEDAAASITSQVARLIRLGESLQKSAEKLGLKTVATGLAGWVTDLTAVREPLGSPVEHLAELDASTLKAVLTFDSTRKGHVDELEGRANALADLAPADEARKVLTEARLRLDDARRSDRVHARSTRLHERADRVMSTYDNAVNTRLESLFESVQTGLSDFYRRINEEDEAGFEAELKYESGAATLEVDFYDRGFFPPGAYHSEGHQDGMGLCLYLALMKELLADEFSLSVLDDVVMSVDADHRKSVCGLIRRCFPDTQFIITTHDKLWMRQMRASGVATGKQLLVFGQWSVDTGPLVAIAGDTWKRTEALLREDDIAGAAAALRYYIEYSARELAIQIGAKVTLRGDGDYELNDLLPAMITRWDGLLKKARKAADSWGHADKVAKIEGLQQHFQEASREFRGEQWAVNPAVHFNEWASFSAGEFRKVVEAYKGLLAGLECTKCDSWVFLERSGADTSSVRCQCQEGFDLNLLAKE